MLSIIFTNIAGLVVKYLFHDRASVSLSIIFTNINSAYGSENSKCFGIILHMIVEDVASSMAK